MFRGQRNNEGRKKGSPNKVTAKVRDAFTHLIESNLEQLEADIKQMKPNERVKVLIDLASFVLPKMKAVEVVASIEQNENELLNKLLKIPDERFNELYKGN